MFCTNCGNQLSGSVEFCPNCGAKITVTRNNESQSVNKVTNSPKNNNESFKEYVDMHIRKSTQFSSAQDLISNSKPWKFVWIIVGICALVGLIMALINEVDILAAVLIMGIMGLGIALIVAAPLASSYEKKFSARINTESDIDIANLCEFLTENLCNIHPSFGKWSLVKSRGLVPLVINQAANMAGEVTIGCEFGVHRKNLAEITIRNKPKNRIYYISAGYNGFLLSFYWEPFLSRSCLIKTAPILQAAMEYYLNYYQTK